MSFSSFPLIAIKRSHKQDCSYFPMYMTIICRMYGYLKTMLYSLKRQLHNLMNAYDTCQDYLFTSEHIAA